LNRRVLPFLLFLLFSLFTGAALFLKIAAVEKDRAAIAEAVFLIKMPDGSLATEAHCIRHRSFGDLFQIFGAGPSLPPYFPSDFIYSPPRYINAGALIEPQTP